MGGPARAPGPTRCRTAPSKRRPHPAPPNGRATLVRSLRAELCLYPTCSALRGADAGSSAPDGPVATDQKRL